MKLLKTALIVAAIATGLTASAQFDLGSQRGEKQNYGVVPGHKVDHKGLIINPTPHSISFTDEGLLPTTRGFRVSDKKKAFANDLGFLSINKHGGARLEITYGDKEAQKAGVHDISGAYALTVTPKKVTITGFDERGAFYGLQTLRQILESDMVKKEHGIPSMTINDYPALPYRGVVEGFYGTPWSHQVRKDLINYMGRNKMNNYIFGPKDDPYHSSPHWRLPYPPKEAAQIADLVETAKKNRLDFYWAIHPGKDIRWNKEDYDSLVAKFNMMYDLGVRSFALFFDDIEGIGTDSHMQTKLLNDFTRDFVDAKGDVSNLFICPTDYSQMWAGKGENGQLAIYGRELNPKAEVFWTGEVVCSDLTPETLEFVDSRIKRPALYWWNYPVTDYCRNILLQGPVYGLDTNLTANEVAGIESNPMEHGEASTLALYGVADWAWNPKAYNALDNWERGLVDRLPDASEAYRNFAINSADTETGYRRDESWETQIFPYNNYTQAQFDELTQRLTEAASAEQAILNSESNPALVGELRPWLTQLTKVANRGLNTLKLIKIFEGGDNAKFWGAYQSNLMTPEDEAEYQAHKVGTLKLQPFYEKAMDGMIIDFYKKLTNTVPGVQIPVGSYKNINTPSAKLMLDGDTTTYYHSGAGQNAGDWIGIDLGQVTPVDEISIKQGRNNVNDVDYFDNVALEVSTDGKNWKALTPDLQKTYDIDWKGEPVDARYVRIVRRDSKRTNWASVRKFLVNPLTQERVGLNVEATMIDNALLAFDRNPLTSYKCDGKLSFDRKAGANELIVLLGNNPGKVSVKQFNEMGSLINETSTDGPFTTLKIDSSTKRIELDGNATVYELIQQ